MNVELRLIPDTSAPKRNLYTMNRPSPPWSSRRPTFRPLLILTLAWTAGVVACGGNNDPGRLPSSEGPPASGATTSFGGDGSHASTSIPFGQEQLVLWPDPSTVFTSPRAVAEDFVAQVLRVPPEISDFMAGDSRSGEVVVFSPGDPPSSRGLLVLRQLGHRNGWFVIGTINDSALISTPEFGQAVPSGEVVVRGIAEGFEATVIVEAFVVGRAEPILDRKVTYAGNLGVPAPFEVTLDLSEAASGDHVLIIVHGGVGLETDPGQFGAIAVVVLP